MELEKISKENYKATCFENKKAQAGLTSKMTSLLGGVILIFLVVALAPDIFSELVELEDNSDVPDWIYTVMVVIVGAGLVFLIYRTFM